MNVRKTTTKRKTSVKKSIKHTSPKKSKTTTPDKFLHKRKDELRKQWFDIQNAKNKKKASPKESKTTTPDKFLHKRKDELRKQWVDIQNAKNKAHTPAQISEEQARQGFTNYLRASKEVSAHEVVTDSRRTKHLDVIACLEGTRRFIAVPIPERDRTQYHWPVANQLFYLSTGTSNEGKNFPDTFFPTGGVDESSGWVMKFGSNREYMAWRGVFCDLYNPSDEGTIEAFREDYKQRCRSLDNFLNKFTFWFQVQISAALGGSFWARPDVQFLRGLALNYSWNGSKLQFIEDDGIPLYCINKAKCTGKYEDNKQQNELFARTDALLGVDPSQMWSRIQTAQSVLLTEEKLYFKR